MSGWVLDEKSSVSQEQWGGKSAPHTLPVTLSQVRHTAIGQDWSAKNIAQKPKITLIKDPPTESLIITFQCY